MSVSNNIEQSNFMLNLQDKDDNHFDWITENIAIGDYNSSYKPFRFIVNINFPDNHCSHRSVYERYFDYENKWYMVLSVGMYDHEKEPFLNFVKKVLRKLHIAKQHDPEGKILFHCYAGISRSVAFAIAYMVENESCTVDETLDKISIARPQVSPKEEYITALKKHYSC